jgi:DNA-binding transcriptional LysR family regulator
MDIKSFDLNLLLVFDAVMRTRSLTAAGHELGRAQPTISHALGRLRALSGDPLFVRTRNFLEPTPLAQKLADPISEALALVQSSLSCTMLFQAERSQASFTILMSDIGQLDLLPQLVRRLRQQAPNVRLVAAQLPREAYADAMQQGRADLAVGAISQLKGGFMQQRLFTTAYACMVGADNELFGERLSLAQYVGANHVGIISPGLSEIEIERLLLPAGRSRRIVVRVPHYLAAPGLLPGTDLVATLPKRVLAAYPYPERLRQLPLPVDVPVMTVHQYWHERAHHDAAHRWLRSTVADLFMERGLDSQPEPFQPQESLPVAS